MNFEFLKGSAIVAAVIGFWDKIKVLLWKILSIVIQRIELDSEYASETVIAYLVTHHKKLPSYDRVYGAIYDSYRNGRYGLVAYEKFGSNSIFFLTNNKFFKFLRLPFYFSQSKVNLGGDSSQDSNSSTEKTLSTITCIRGTVNFDEIIENSVNMRNRLNWNIHEREKDVNRFNIIYFPEREPDGNDKARYNPGFAWYRQSQYRLLGVLEEDLGREKFSDGKALGNLFFPKEVKDLIHIISLWVKSKDWYKEKNIPWKRGWLLYGPPGTGKTALARAFAEDLDMPIYFFSLAQMSNHDLITSWQSMQLNIPCIALIEDIDNVFDKRTNICQNQFTFSSMFSKNEEAGAGGGAGMRTPLTFDTLLNCIDGVDKSNGIFTIITTNDISKIDPAIGVPEVLEDGTHIFKSTRPGRIDKAIELTYMKRENKIEMANKILSDFDYKLGEVYAHINKNEQETPAQFQEFCSQIALQEYWKQNSKS